MKKRPHKIATGALKKGGAWFISWPKFEGLESRVISRAGRELKQVALISV